MKMRFVSRFFLPAVMVLLCATICLACPTCKDAVAEGGNDANLVRGFGWSIIFMMSVPFLIFGGLSAYFYYEVCRARRMVGQPQVELPVDSLASCS